MEEKCTENLDNILAEITAANDESREEGWVMSDRERQSAYEFLSNIRTLSTDIINESAIRNYADQQRILYNLIKCVRDRANEALDSLTETGSSYYCGKTLDGGIQMTIEELRDEMLGSYQIIERLGDIWNYDREYDYKDHTVLKNTMNCFSTMAESIQSMEFFNYLAVIINSNIHLFNKEFQRFDQRFIYKNSFKEDIPFRNAMIACGKPSESSLSLSMVMSSKRCNTYLHLITVYTAGRGKDHAGKYEIRVNHNIFSEIRLLNDDSNKNTSIPGKVINKLNDIRYQFSIRDIYRYSLSKNQKSILKSMPFSNPEKYVYHIPDDNQLNDIISGIRDVIHDCVDICNEYYQPAEKEEE